MPITLATREAQIGRTAVQGQSRQKVRETLNSINKPGVVVHLSFELQGRPEYEDHSPS
jgi:hypothetical protein